MNKAKALIIMCIDFRFQEKIQHYLEAQGFLGACDELAIAGCTRDFVRPMSDAAREYVWGQLDLALKLHQPDKVIFIDHQDCGGYAQDGTIKGGLAKDVDEKAHKHFMQELASQFIKRFGQKQLVFLYAPLEGEIETVF